MAATLYGLTPLSSIYGRINFLSLPLPVANLHSKRESKLYSTGSNYPTHKGQYVLPVLSHMTCHFPQATPTFQCSIILNQ